MIIRTVLNFTGLYVAFQLCIISVGEVFNIEMNSGIHIGAMIGAAYGAMAASVSVFGRAPTFRENWIMSVFVNVTALIVSLIFLSIIILGSGDALLIESPMTLMSELPLEFLIIGFAVAFLLQTLLCLLIFDKVARRYLIKLNLS